jgi:hypothetical protein
VSRSAGPATVTLTYGRGTGASRGNGVNLAVETDLTLGDRLRVGPAIQLDYLDQYGAPAGLADRISSLELRLPVSYAVGRLSLMAAGYLTLVQSPYVREANLAAGGSAHTLVPWFAAGLSFTR